MAAGNEQTNIALVTYASVADCSGVQDLIRFGADVKYQHGLGLLLAAANGHSDIIKIFVSAGVDDPHTLTLASRIALVNKHFEDAAYLLAWADMYASGRVPPNHNAITANIDGC
eukprot:gene4140-14240_t